MLIPIRQGRLVTAKIQAASDSGERQRLMDEHMKSMQETMSIMGRMAGGGTGQRADRTAEKMEHCTEMMKTMMQQMREAGE
jgi:hypothetical protein